MICVTELDGRVSGMVWTTMFISLAAAITIQRRSSVLTFVVSVIIRCIFSIGLEPTLILLGVLNVSRRSDTRMLHFLWQMPSLFDRHCSVA